MEVLLLKSQCHPTSSIWSQWDPALTSMWFLYHKVGSFVYRSQCHPASPIWSQWDPALTPMWYLYNKVWSFLLKSQCHPESPIWSQWDPALTPMWYLYNIMVSFVFMSQCHPAPQWQLSKSTPTNPKHDESVWVPMNLQLGPSRALNTLHTKLSCTGKGEIQSGWIFQ